MFILYFYVYLYIYVSTSYGLIHQPVGENHMWILWNKRCTFIWNQSNVFHSWVLTIQSYSCRYKCPANGSVPDALAAYDKSFTGSSEYGQYAAPPSPGYLEEIGLVERDVQDVTYHLLKLYADRTHPLHSILNPTTMTANQLDYSLRYRLDCSLTTGWGRLDFTVTTVSWRYRLDCS